MRLSALILAGGDGSRMGRDKARLDFDGELLAARVLRMLRRMTDDVVVCSGDGRRMDWLGERQVADALPHAGPLGGIVGGLEAASRELVAVVAVDMPYANGEVLELLAHRWDGEDAVVPRTLRGLEPLHAVYARTAAPRLRAALDAGEWTVHRALETLDVAEVGSDEWGGIDPEGRFAVNWNRPEDLPG